MYSAWDMPDRRRGIAVAKEALRLSPLCADAFVLLAEESARDPLKLSSSIDRGGSRRARPRASAVQRGYRPRLGLLETRPYMRARSGLAQGLWTVGRVDEAIGHCRELLRLNPNDNQGNRYMLAECLLKLDREDEVAALIDSYGKEWSTEFSYTAALLAFRRHGDAAEARTLLRRAVNVNGYVPTYLLGRKRLPRKLPPYITLGGEDEAQECARRYGPCWAGTTAALQWLTGNTEG